MVVIAPSFPPAQRAGGPTRSMDALITTCPERFRCWVIAPDRDHGTSDPLPVARNTWTPLGQHQINYTSIESTRQFAAALVDTRRVKPALVYVNSLFSIRLGLLPILLHRLGFWPGSKLILAPRGQLAAGPLTQAARKKHHYTRLFRAMRLHRGLMWHSTAQHETSDIKSVFGNSTKIVERANETRLPETGLPPAHATRSRCRVAFVARLVQTKGLHLPLQALSEVSGPLDFDVIGPEEDDHYVRLCKELARSVGGDIRIRFLGAHPAESMREAMASYDAIVFPTSGENFGHGIIEALSASCRVLCHDTTPWSALLRAGGGRIVEPTAEDWRSALQDLVDALPAERFEDRLSAGRAYSIWASQPRERHLFALVLEPAD